MSAEGASISYLVPLEAKLEKTAPYWGGQFVRYDNQLKLGIGLNIGQTEKQYGSIATLSATDVIGNIYMNYILGSFPNGKLDGLYGLIGCGGYFERAEFTGTILGKSYSEKLEKNMFAPEFGVGILFTTGAVETKYLLFTNSENVTSAVMVSAVIFFSGTR